MVRLDLGAIRPYLVTHPDHVQYVLRDNSANYLREGMLWRPLRRLLGNGLAGEGPVWAERRRLFKPLFSAKNVSLLMDQMSEAIEATVAGFDHYAATGRPFDAQVEMMHIVHGVFRRVFFGDRISRQDTDRLGHAVAVALTSLGARMLMPIVPHSVPMPGDRAYRRAGRVVDEIMNPLIRESRRGGPERDDIVSVLCRTAAGPDGEPLDDKSVRDDIIAMFAAGTESTSLTLTWLWVVLDTHPDVAERMIAEVTSVVGDEPIGRSHLPRLTYTKMVLQELLRMYPVGWIMPRMAAADDVLDGVRIKAGTTVLLSPYLMHRLENLWDRPHEFDPERFAPERAAAYGFAYMPFGAGPHTCLGSHFFTTEAQLIIAAMLRRYRPRLRDGAAITPRALASVRPSRQVEMILRPAPAAAANTQPA
ncbi:MAG TPA: cytochrome P450 [Thermopolyspora sp.]